MSRTRTLLEQHSVVDLFTMVYVAVDDYIQHSLEHHRFVLPENSDQKASYSELMTISLIGDLLAQPYSGDWFVWVKHEYALLFPCLPDVSRYYRVLCNLERIFADFALVLANSLEDDTTYSIDSKPVPICKYKRRKHPRAQGEAARGYGTQGPVFGFKLHAITNNVQMVCRFAVVPANFADVTLGQALLHPEYDELERVLGDKAYLGTGAWTPPKRNAKQPGPWTVWMDNARKLIETVFSSLTRKGQLVLGQLNSFRSVRAKVCRKVAAHNFARWLGL